VEAPAEGFSITVRKNPWNGDGIAAVINSSSPAETGAAFEKIFHYGKYSSLAFEKGRNVSKKIDPSERGIIVLLREEPAVIDLGALRRFSAVVEGASDKRIVYIGEYHDRFSHHNVQLQLLKALHARDRSIALGMEMFQRPFQGTLDEYIAGTIDEREFLRRSEYFRRWGFDYNLYKPILDYCRSEKVPVVALNMRREIIDKVAKGGMDALSNDERKELPREMDFSNEDYRRRIREAFGQHRDPGERNFDFFLQAQVLWDETMAETVARYLDGRPGRRMVVVAGGGHVVYGDGIPKRAHRRNGLPYTIVLNDGSIEPGIADYLIFPPALDGMTAPKLLATFKEAGMRLVINDFVNESPAKAAGLRAGDALIALDGVPVSTVQEVKLALHYKNKGDTLLVTVARKRFLLGEKVMTVEVKL
jgi:aminopeptidase N